MIKTCWILLGVMVVSLNASATCTSMVAKKQALKSYIESKYSTKSILFGYEDKAKSQVDVRFYLATEDCMGTFAISNSCEVRDAGVSYLGSNGMETSASFCWTRATGPQDD